jgi:hypothetical protein
MNDITFVGLDVHKATQSEPAEAICLGHIVGHRKSF